MKPLIEKQLTVYSDKICRLVFKDVSYAYNELGVLYIRNDKDEVEAMFSPASKWVVVISPAPTASR